MYTLKYYVKQHDSFLSFTFSIVFKFYVVPNFILFRVNCCQLINYITICGMAVLLITLAVKMVVFDSKLMTQH